MAAGLLMLQYFAHLVSWCMDTGMHAATRLLLLGWVLGVYCLNNEELLNLCNRVLLFEAC
jgi:hypothetical protein